MTNIRLVFGAAVVLLAGACSIPRPEPEAPQPPPAAAIPEKTVTASFYGAGDGFDGKKTASGEVFDSRSLTAAHPTLPFNTVLKVTNPKNGKTVRVRVNDRGPHAKGRSLDLSTKKEKKIGLDKEGVGPVKIAVVPNAAVPNAAVPNQPTASEEANGAAEATPK